MSLVVRAGPVKWMMYAAIGVFAIVGLAMVTSAPGQVSTRLLGAVIAVLSVWALARYRRSGVIVADGEVMLRSVIGRRKVIPVERVERFEAGAEEMLLPLFNVLLVRLRGGTVCVCPEIRKLRWSRRSRLSMDELVEKLNRALLEPDGDKSGIQS